MLSFSGAYAANLSRDEFKSGKTAIAAAYKADKAACSSQGGNARDICVEQAKARQKVAYADLDYRYSGKPADLNKVGVAQAESTYAVAKERCDDRSGNDKDICVKEAKAIEIKTLADLRTERKVDDAQSDAGKAKHEADYKVAAEKCESLAGDARSTCMSAAKAEHRP